MQIPCLLKFPLKFSIHDECFLIELLVELQNAYFQLHIWSHTSHLAFSPAFHYKQDSLVLIIYVFIISMNSPISTFYGLSLMTYLIWYSHCVRFCQEETLKDDSHVLVIGSNLFFVFKHICAFWRSSVPGSSCTFMFQPWSLFWIPRIPGFFS